MRLSRHAKNRLRWIGRRHSSVTAAGLLENLPGSETIGYDDRGNRRALVVLGETRLTLVIDEAQALVITVWVE